MRRIAGVGASRLRILAWLALLAVAACRPLPPPAAHDVDPIAAELDDACVRRDLASCLDAGRRYEQELGGDARRSEHAERRVVVTYYRGCVIGQAEACARLADFVARRPGALARDRVRLAAMFEHACGTPHPRHPAPCASAALHARACDLGRASSCGALAALRDAGRLEARGLGGLSPARLHALACERGWAASCERVAELLLRGADRDPVGAARLLARACDGGGAAVGPACMLLAERHARGDGARLDQVRARALRARACEADHGDGCYALARMERLGLGGEQQPASAMAHLRQACDLGSPRACEDLAKATELGDGVAEDKASAFDLNRRATELYQKRCDAGDIQACADLGRQLRLGGGGPADEARGRGLQREACERGNADGCIGVMMRGAMFLPGKGEVIGGAALARACRAGDGDACFVLGRIGRRALPLLAAPSVDAVLRRGCALGSAASCNAAGVGAFPPDARRRAQLARACSMGDALGCHHLALYVERAGPDQDLERAERLQRRSCRWGYAPACTRLGMIRGGGGTRGANPDAAASLFARACRLGDAEGCHRLGAMRVAGARVAQRLDEGRQLLEQACRQGAHAACGLLGSLLLRGHHLERDRATGASLLEGACRDGEPRACAEYAEALRRGELLPRDEGRARDVLHRAAPGAIAGCARGLSSCYDGEASSAGAVWTTFSGAPARTLAGVPACDAALERVCEDATDVAVARCEHADAGCFEAADLLRRMLAVGLGASRKELRDTLRRGVDLAERACDRGDAEACARAAEAHRRGEGAREDAGQAKRYADRACRLDAARCAD